MLNEHITRYHDRINLNIDVEKLGKAYLDFKYHLGFRTDDKTKFDFNAICVNRIPGDEKSIQGGNVRGLYWTYPDETNHEEERCPVIQEEKYTELCPEFKGTYVEEVYNIVRSKFNIGRMRFLMKPPRSCLSWHRDTSRRIHFPIKTQEGCFMVIENEILHLKKDQWYLTDTMPNHTAFNASKENRIHLVAVVL